MSLRPDAAGGYDRKPDKRKSKPKVKPKVKARAPGVRPGQLDADDIKVRTRAKPLDADQIKVRERQTQAAQKRLDSDNRTPKGLVIVDAEARRKAPTASAHTRGEQLMSGGPRVLANTARGVAEAIVKDPVASAEKTARQAGEIAKGVASAAIALPLYAPTYAAKKAIGKDPGDSPIEIGSRMLKAEGKRLSDTYGPNYRNEKGSGKKLREQIRKEGPLIPALDVATVVAPGAAVAGSGVRTAAAVGRGGAAAKRLANPAPVRKSPLGEAESRKARQGITGMAAVVARDSARNAAQKAAVARKDKRLRVRAVQKVTGKNIERVEGRRASILNTEPKPLLARRQQLKPGEVTPISPFNVSKALRVDTAKGMGLAEAAAARRTIRHVTGTAKGATSLRSTFKGLDPELEHAALTAARFGIRDSKGAGPILARHIAQIEATLAKAPGKKTDPDHKAATRDSEAPERELARLRAYVADPKVFERPDVRKAAEGASAARIGAREGLDPDRAAYGRAGLVGETLGIKTAKQSNEAAIAQRKAQQSAAKREGVASVRAAGAKVASAKAAHAKAVATLEHAKGRAEILTRNVDGRERIPGKPADGTSARYAGGQVGVSAAEAGVATARAALDEAQIGAKVARAQVRASRKAAAAPVKLKHETGREYEARVAAAQAAEGRDAPAYLPSKYEADDGALRTERAHEGKANPLSRSRKGVIFRTGQEGRNLGTLEQNLTAGLRRGARLEAQSKIIAAHGKVFRSNDAANKWASERGLDTRPDGKSDMVITAIPNGMARKDLVSPRHGAGSEAGDYVKTDDVVLLPRTVHEELVALDEHAATPPSALKRTLGGSQAALLAFNPAWFQFQRVNDAVAATIGGSIQNTRGLEQLRKSLDPDSREVLDTVAGGSMSQEMLTPHSAQKMGRIKTILDQNPTFRDALKTKTPATILLRAGASGPTALLRADQAITGGFRERQLLHNLQRVAARMDPEVTKINKAFGPIGRAFQKGDPELIGKLLKDPAYQKQLAEATDSLYRVHGDWHNYTAREHKLKHYAAFYGFLRYATKMALFTLPVNHPNVGLLISQLGVMGAEDAKAIVGPDMPWGLGTLYNKDGTIAADFARANPLTGPLLSITKPEQMPGLASPLASIAVSYVLGQPVGLSDSTEGYVAQYTVKSDPKNHAIGSFLAEERLRIVLGQTIRMLGFMSEWQRFDSRVQSSDSLPWDRRIMKAAAGPEKARLDAKNANRPGGTEGLAHNVLPLAFPGSRRNAKVQGAALTAAKTKRRNDEEIRQIERKKTLETEYGQLKLEVDALKAEMAAEMEDTEMLELRHEVRKLRAEIGG